MIGRCGMRCHKCPAFVGNVNGPADQARAAPSWAHYWDVNLPPEALRCNGCLADDSGGLALPQPDCPIRPCATEKGLATCAQCPDYPCDRLRLLMDACDGVVQRFRAAISQEEYDRFIRPYEVRTTLEGLRRGRD